MSDFDNPEFAIPFTFTSDGSALEIEVDSDAEIQQGVWTVLSYEPGQLLVDPQFGMPDQSFKKNGVDLDLLTTTIQRFDSRAVEVIEEDPLWFSTLVERIVIRRDPDA